MPSILPCLLRWLGHELRQALDGELGIWPLSCKVHQATHYTSIAGDVFTLQFLTFVLAEILLCGCLPVGLLEDVHVLCQTLVLLVVAPDVTPVIV